MIKPFPLSPVDSLSTQVAIAMHHVTGKISTTRGAAAIAPSGLFQSALFVRRTPQLHIQEIVWDAQIPASKSSITKQVEAMCA